MSFQRFRVQSMASAVVPPPHGVATFAVPFNAREPLTADSARPSASFRVQMHNGGPKMPYGSGDIDDGYTLVFPTMEAFQTWRAREEDEKVVEFVKGDTHVSKAVPPRFKEHTKLVCARHNRSGRKKYVKKYPERVRKVPSRKLEGQGCPASISYKTYHDSDEVRAMYSPEHSHETGPANLPFTRKGRKAMNSRGKAKQTPGDEPFVTLTPEAVAGPSTASTPSEAPSPEAGPSNHVSGVALPPPHANAAPLPTQSSQNAEGLQQRWDRMGVLFESVRNHARQFSFPPDSVSALESILIRMYLESPIGQDMAYSVMGGDPALRHRPQ